MRKDGSILVGGSGKGRIYEVRPDGGAHALFDSPLSEISAIYVDAGGVGWAAGASNVLPSSAPSKPQPKSAQPASGSGTTTGAAEPKKEEPTPSVEVSYSFDEGSSAAAAATGGGSGEIYRIDPDGFVQTVRKFDREMVYAISGGANGTILLSSGPQGRVYSLITTTNSGAVYRMEGGPSQKAEFRSAAKDVERFSRFGHYRIEGSDVDDGHVAIAFRSGNTRTPDATWSAWSAATAAPQGAIIAPAGRYVQWKLTMPNPANDIVVDTVTLAFVNRNIAPAIDAVVVQDPAVVYITGSYPQSPQVVEATNPDEYGIFTSLEPSRDKNEPGKKVYRKGYRTVTWRAHDENNDSLRYSLSFRRKGTEKWLRLRENVEETSMNFDTSQLPDGLYELRLVVTDAVDNPDAPLSDAKEGVEFQVDNTPPQIASMVSGNDVVIRVTDKLSAIGKVEYSADAQKWIRLTPVDGIADSADETYRLSRGAVAGKFAIVRATDAYYNVVTESITLP